MSYSKSHVILIAYAIDTPESLENVTIKACDIIFSALPHLISNLVDRGGTQHLWADYPGHPCWLQGGSAAGASR